MTAEAGISGKVEGQRLRGRLLVGVAAPASARIEAVAPFGPPFFIFAADERDATLLLPRDQRVVEHGRPEAILSAIAGVSMDAQELHITLTGCWPPDPDVRAGERFGANWRTVTVEPDHRIAMHRDGESANWHIVSVARNTAHSGRQWTAEYRDFDNDLPRTIRIASAASSAYDLRLSLSQVETNVTLERGAFQVQVPRDAERITIDELKRARPGIREN